MDAMIKYDKSTRSRLMVFVHYAINIVFLALTIVAAVLESMYVRKARHDGDVLVQEGKQAGIISDHARNAFGDPLVVSIQVSG